MAATRSAAFADIDLSGPKGKNAWFGGGYVDPSEPAHTLAVTAVCLQR